MWTVTELNGTECLLGFRNDSLCVVEEDLKDDNGSPSVRSDISLSRVG